MGTHMVVVRYDSLKFADNKIVLPGGTKDGLRMLPAFQYSKGHLEKFLSPKLRESDSMTAIANRRRERASHGAEGLFRC
jgi:hypothetical protein